MLKIDAKELHTFVNKGIKMMPKGDRNVSCVLESTKNALVVRFTSATVIYAARMKPKSEDTPLGAFAFDPTILVKSLAGKTGDAQLSVTRDKLSVKMKTTSLTLPRLVVPDSSICDMSVLWTKRGESIDITPLTSLGTNLKKVLAAIRDHVSKSELTAAARWDKKKLNVLLADPFHGVMLSSEFQKNTAPQSSGALSIPVSALSLIVEIANTVYVTDTTCIASSKTEFLDATLVESSQSLTFDIFEGLIGAKPLSKCVTSGGLFSEARKTVSSVADDIQSITLDMQKDKASLHMDSDHGFVRERFPISDFKGKPCKVVLSNSNMSDLLVCLPDAFEIRIAKTQQALTCALEGTEGKDDNRMLIQAIILATETE